jgi:hypothetical protein
MRAMCFALLCAFAVGCGKTAPTTGRASADTDSEPAPAGSPPTKPSRPAPKEPAPKKAQPKDDGTLAFDGLSNTISNDYFNDPGRADTKYKDKRVRLKGRIDQINPRKDGLSLGYCGVHDMGRMVEPTVLFFFAKDDEKTASDVKKGMLATIEGVCRGRIEDDAKRVPGYTFHVRIEGCKVLNVELEKK